MLVYMLLFMVILAISIYSIIIFFSHKPREPTPSELTYTTNDSAGEHYELPRRLNSSTSEYKDYGIQLSVVIPCFNETERLGKMLNECIEHLNANYPSQYEIIIVDDGSLDKSDEFALKKADEFRLKPHVMRVVRLSKNRGKGGAVTHGLLHSRGKFSLFADADGATKFSDADKLVAYLSSVDDYKPAIAIGSRAHMVDTDAVVKRSFIRNFLMYGLHTLVYIFGIRDIQDTQCGFKMFNFQSVRLVFPHMHTERWIFDVEVLLIGELQKMSMKEIPVNWQEVDGSKIDIAKDSIGMAIDLVVTRLAYLLGIYKLDECGKLNSNNKKFD
mmetsp:Transcript_7274/g.9212  ORF Transcript_7274/g.9212 Transcript_7274/m.9212 type:complete len:329 (+) Transcript_7274:81-1067(+)